MIVIWFVTHPVGIFCCQIYAGYYSIKIRNLILETPWPYISIAWNLHHLLIHQLLLSSFSLWLARSQDSFNLCWAARSPFFRGLKLKCPKPWRGISLMTCLISHYGCSWCCWGCWCARWVGVTFYHIILCYFHVWWYSHNIKYRNETGNVSLPLCG